MFRSVTGEVVAHAGERLETTGGEVRVSPFTYLRRGDVLTLLADGDLRAGETVEVLGRRDPADGQIVASIVVPATGS